MGKIKDILVESRDFNRQVMATLPHRSYMYAGFCLQTWGLNRMIGFIDHTTRARNKIVSRMKTRGK